MTTIKTEKLDAAFITLGKESDGTYCVMVDTEKHVVFEAWFETIQEAERAFDRNVEHWTTKVLKEAIFDDTTLRLTSQGDKYFVEENGYSTSYKNKKWAKRYFLKRQLTSVAEGGELPENDGVVEEVIALGKEATAHLQRCTGSCYALGRALMGIKINRAKMHGYLDVLLDLVEDDQEEMLKEMPETLDIVEAEAAMNKAFDDPKFIGNVKKALSFIG